MPYAIDPQISASHTLGRGEPLKRATERVLGTERYPCRTSSERTAEAARNAQWRFSFLFCLPSIRHGHRSDPVERLLVLRPPPFRVFFLWSRVWFRVLDRHLRRWWAPCRNATAGRGAAWTSTRYSRWPAGTYKSRPGGKMTAMRNDEGAGRGGPPPCGRYSTTTI